MPNSRSKTDKATTYSALHTRYLKDRDGWTQNFRLRVHRALSWLKAAQAADDLDTRFILLWIAFNAAYAKEHDEEVSPKGRRMLLEFFQSICRLDAGQRIYAIIWSDFASSIRLLLDNPYVFHVYWLSASGKLPGQQWQDKFERSKQRVRKALGKQDTVTIVHELFLRLYTLRNQLVHGGATWHGRVNRPQLRNGTRVLERVVPAVLLTMMDHPQSPWGTPEYPVQ